MTTETKARAEGPDVSAAEEMKFALRDFVENITAFQSDFANRLSQQEERLTMLDRKSRSAPRPALATCTEIEAPHRTAFGAYVRSGDDDGLRALSLDGKAMNTAVAGDGGYLVDPQTSNNVKSALLSTASIRRIANVVNVEATSYDVLIDTSEMGAGWASEVGSVSETTTSQIDRITIPLNELSALPKASQRLLDDAAFDIEGWLAQRIAESFARAEAAAFIKGDGNEKPRGFLDHPTVPNESWSWGQLGYVATAADGDFAGPDAIVDLVYSLGAEYRANGTFVMNSRTTAAIRRMKDADGRFLWSDGLAAGEPARLMGYPVIIAEDMPDIGPDADAVAFGDFSAGYTIAERPDLRILRDPFTAKPHVLFYATKRVGADVSDFSAIKLLRFSAS